MTHLRRIHGPAPDPRRSRWLAVATTGAALRAVASVAVMASRRHTAASTTSGDHPSRLPAGETTSWGGTERITAASGGERTTPPRRCGSFPGVDGAHQAAERLLGLVGRRRRYIIGMHREGVVALTFDGGPEPGVTAHHLDVLAESGATATFFVALDRARARPDLVRRIVDDGHEVGVYAGGDTATPLDASRIPVLIAHARRELERIVGAPVIWVRPPESRWSPRVIGAVHRERLTPVLWSAIVHDPPVADAGGPLSDVRRVAPGDVVLVRGGRTTTGRGVGAAVESPVGESALKAAVDDWHARGLQVRSIGQALGFGRPRYEVRFRDRPPGAAGRPGDAGAGCA